MTNNSLVKNDPLILRKIIEASIFAANKALSMDKLLRLFSAEDAVDKNMIGDTLAQLKGEYQGRGVELIEVSSGFRFQVISSAAPWVSRLWDEKPQKYSRALLETLALVAYRQPVTRGEIEEIRGVSVSSQIMRTLVEREWVRIIGHKDVPGKPAMYATTKIFLDYFSLKKLDELPTLAEIRDLDTINAELDFGETEGLDSAGGFSSESEEKAKNEKTSDPERIDIDNALSALKETYQKIDGLNNNSLSEENNKPS